MKVEMSDGLQILDRKFVGKIHSPKIVAVAFPQTYFQIRQVYMAVRNCAQVHVMCSLLW